MIGVAAILAMRGLRVGMLDFDLDASGLATILEANPEMVGIHDLLHILKRADPSAVFECIIDVTDLVSERFGYQPQGNGCLKYIPTISDPELSDQIMFNPATSYSVDAILEAIVRDCGVDQLLIDLRPGYSPSSSLIFPLVDHAVVITRLDRQNIEGLRTVVPQMHQKGLETTIVANYLTDNPLVEKRIRLLEEAMNSRVDVRIDFDPDLLYDDDIVRVATEGSPMNVALNALAGLIQQRIAERKE